MFSNTFVSDSNIGRKNAILTLLTDGGGCPTIDLDIVLYLDNKAEDNKHHVFQYGIAFRYSVAYCFENKYGGRPDNEQNK